MPHASPAPPRPTPAVLQQLALLGAHWLRQRGRLGAWLGTACVGTLTAAALVAAHYHLRRTGLGLLVAAGLAAGMAGMGALVARWPLRWSARLLLALPAQGLLWATSRLSHSLPEFGHLLRPAAELAGLGARSAETPETATAAALRGAYLAQLGAKLQAPALPHRLAEGVNRCRRRARAAAAVGCLLAAALLTVRPILARRLWASLCGTPLVETSAAPLCYDFELQLRYPAYTERTPWSQTGSTGDVRALQGSMATLTARPTLAATAAWVRVWTESADDQQLPASVLADGRVQVQLPVNQPGRYAFVLADATGRHQQDCAQHRLQPVTDAPPTVVLEAPSKDLTVKTGDSVAVVWRAEDDWGLARAWIVLESGQGEPTRLQLPLKNHGRKARGRRVLPAHVLPLGPEQPLTLYVQAEDAQTPPGIGRSVRRQLRLFSPQAHHREILAKLQAGQDLLVDWLAWEWALVEPAPAGKPPADPTAPLPQPLSAAIARAGQAFAALDDALKNDRLAEASVRQIVHEVRRHTQQAAPAGAQSLPLAARRKHVLEQDISYLDGLQHRSNATQMQRDAADVRLTGRALRQQLKAGMGHTEPERTEARRAVQAQLDKLRAQVAQLLERAGASGRAMPRSFANVEAQQGNKWQQTLERIDQELAKGDGEGAAKELDHLGEMVEAMAKSLEQAKQQTAPPELAAVQAQLEALSQQANQLAQEQNQLLGRMDAWREQQVRAAVQQSPAAALAEARRQVAAAKAALKPLMQMPPLAAQVGHEVRGLQTSLNDLDLLLQQPQLHQAAGELALAGNRLREVDARLHPNDPALAGQTNAGKDLARPFGRPNVPAAGRQAVVQAGRALAEVQRLLTPLLAHNAAPSPNSPLAQALAALAGDEAALAERSQQAAAQMQALHEALPMLGEQGGALLEQATQALRAASQDLAAGKAGDGQQQAARGQQRLAAFVAAAQAQAAGAKAAGMPMPVGADPQAGEGEGPSDPSGGQGSGGGQAPGGQKPGQGPHGERGDEPGEAGQGGEQAGGESGEGAPADGAGRGRAGGEQDVDLPDAHTGGPSPAFRRQLQEAAKQRPPPRYAPAVRGYYDELMR